MTMEHPLIEQRDYQSQLTNEAVKSLRQGLKTLLWLPTGGGKTIVFSAVARRFIVESQTVLVLAHRQELITQAAAKLQAFTGIAPGVIKAGITPSPDSPIQVASVQTAQRRLSQLAKPGLIIIDEAHHTPAKSYQAVVSLFPNVPLLGVTATPCRLDRRGLADYFDAMVLGPTVKQLIKDEYLAPYRLFADPSPMVENVAIQAGDFSTRAIATTNKAKHLSGRLVETYQQYSPGKRCIVFAVTVAHSRAIAKRYCDAGIPAASIDATTPDMERQTILEDFRVGKLKVICNKELFTEGFDLPEIDVVQVARPTQSLAFWLQMIGRAMRRCDGKSHALIFDHTNNWRRFGPPDFEHRWSLESVETPTPEIRLKVQDGFVVDKTPAEIIESERQLKELSRDSFDAHMDAHEDSTARYVLESEQRNRKPRQLKTMIVSSPCIEGGAERIAGTRFVISRLFERIAESGIDKPFWTQRHNPQHSSQRTETEYRRYLAEMLQDAKNKAVRSLYLDLNNQDFEAFRAHAVIKLAQNVAASIKA